MKKMLMLVASVAMAVALTGCGCSKQSDDEKKAQEGVGSPKDVAEDFAKAIVQRNTDKAFGFYDAFQQSGKHQYALRTKEQKNDIKQRIEKYGKTINDDKCDCKAILEDVTVPAGDLDYHLVNGKKYTGEEAKVLVQFMKGGDKKPEGLEVSLVKVDGSWKVTDYAEVSGLDTSDDSEEEKTKLDTSNDSGADRAKDVAVPWNRQYDKDRDVAMPAMAASSKTVKRDSAEKKDESEYDEEKSFRVRKFKRLCEEAATLVDLSREQIEDEVKKFKNVSEEEQEKILEKAERQLREMRRSAAGQSQSPSKRYENANQ